MLLYPNSSDILHKIPNVPLLVDKLYLNFHILYKQKREYCPNPDFIMLDTDKNKIWPDFKHNTKDSTLW